MELSQGHGFLGIMENLLLIWLESMFEYRMLMIRACVMLRFCLAYTSGRKTLSFVLCLQGDVETTQKFVMSIVFLASSQYRVIVHQRMEGF